MTAKTITRYQFFSSVTYISKTSDSYQAWWSTSVISVLAWLKQEDCYNFETSLSYIVNSSQSKLTPTSQ